MRKLIVFDFDLLLECLIKVFFAAKVIKVVNVCCVLHPLDNDDDSFLNGLR